MGTEGKKVELECLLEYLLEFLLLFLLECLLECLLEFCLPLFPLLLPQGAEPARTETKK